MKTKLLNFKALAIMMACLSCALSASAYDFYSGGIYYTKLASNTVEVAYRDVLTADYSGSVTIPATVTYGGVTYTVKGIGYCAFGECTNLTSVTFPNTLTYIGELAFIRCSSLTSANIPSGVTWIGSNAFCYCYELESVTIPSTVTTIGYNAFTACKMSFPRALCPSAIVHSIGAIIWNWCYVQLSLHRRLATRFLAPTRSPAAHWWSTTFTARDCMKRPVAGVISQPLWLSTTTTSSQAGYITAKPAIIQLPYVPKTRTTTPIAVS